MRMPQAVEQTDQLSRVRALVEEVLSGTPHFVVDVEVRGSTGSRVVTVYVDSDGALGVDTLADISRDLSFLLDTENVIDGAYRLTVSSPGVDRPLRLPRQYRRNVGREVRVHFRLPESEKMTEKAGTLTEADESGIVLSLPNGPLAIPYGDILWAKVQLPW